MTAEACPHHFTLTHEACEGYNTNAKMNPPLREPEDREAIRQGLRDGTIDVICTDHAPHHYDAKEREFDDAPNGIIGLETALGLAITELVDGGLLDAARAGDPDEHDAGPDLRPARRHAGRRRAGGRGGDRPDGAVDGASPRPSTPRAGTRRSPAAASAAGPRRSCAGRWCSREGATPSYIIC